LLDSGSWRLFLRAVSRLVSCQIFDRLPGVPL